MSDPGYTFLPASRQFTITADVTPTLNWFRVRKEILIYNTGAATVYVGFWSNLTTSGDGCGIPVSAGQILNFSNPHSSATFNSPLYMRTLSGTANVLVIEGV